MGDLFSDLTTDEKSGAVISECGKYRYTLWRMWDKTLPTMCWIMLNPSTADASEDDPTIRRCIGFAKREGCGSISVRNLFAYRATNPDELLKAQDPVGPENIKYIGSSRVVSILTIVVAGFGAINKSLLRIATEQISQVRILSPKCFGVTKDGMPRHPLYLKSDAPMIDWVRQ